MGVPNITKAIQSAHAQVILGIYSTTLENNSSHEGALQKLVFNIAVKTAMRNSGFAEEFARQFNKKYPNAGDFEFSFRG
ncbi:MAG: hypothetical protein ACREBF_02275 [Candidatus Micrarchaeales archaeon]